MFTGTSDLLTPVGRQLVSSLFALVYGSVVFSLQTNCFRVEMDSKLLFLVTRRGVKTPKI